MNSGTRFSGNRIVVVRLDARPTTIEGLRFSSDRLLGPIFANTEIADGVLDPGAAKQDLDGAQHLRHRERSEVIYRVRVDGLPAQFG